jgi:hypothetical protein
VYTEAEVKRKFIALNAHIIKEESSMYDLRYHHKKPETNNKKTPKL